MNNSVQKYFHFDSKLPQEIDASVAKTTPASIPDAGVNFD
jgi:hypothetical protein